MVRKILLLFLIMLFVGGAFAYTAPSFERQPIIVESDSDFYGSSEGRVTIDLNLDSIRTDFKDFFVRITGLDNTSTMVKEISYNKEKIETLSYHVSQTSKTKISQKLMDKTPMSITLEFDPEEIGLARKFNVELVDKDGFIIADLDPFLSAYDYRQEWCLDTDGISLSGDITNDHVILFRKDSTDPDFFNVTNSDGNGIAFTDSSNNLYDFHFENFDSVSEEMLAWVEITETFDSSADTCGYTYYGGDLLTNNENETGTYPSNYKAVYHLDDVTSLLDSTSSNWDFTSSGNSNVSFKLNGGQELLDSDYAETISVSTGFSGLSIFGWIQPTDISGLEIIMSQYQGANQSSFQFYANDDDIIGRVYDVDHDYIGRKATAVHEAETNFVGYTWDGTLAGSGINIYVNAEGVDDADDSSGTFNGMNDRSNEILLGANLGGGANFQGKMDEFKIFDYGLSSDEIKLLYNSENNNLVSFGAQEVSALSPDVNLTYPNGNETFDKKYQSKVTITFNVQDGDNNSLLVDLNYSASGVEGTGTVIINDTNTENALITCDDSDFSDSTNCSYDWDISGVADNNYFVMVNVSDGTNDAFDQSDNNFEIKTSPNIVPDVNIFSPNGSERYETGATSTINVEFTVQDGDNNSLLVDLNYSTFDVEGTGTQILIDENTSGVNIICDDSDFSNDTNCLYAWDISGVADNNYYLLINVSDDLNNSFDATDGNFEIYTEIEPKPSGEGVYTERYINPKSTQRDENRYYDPNSTFNLDEDEKQTQELRVMNNFLLYFGVIIVGVLIILGVVLWKKR